MGIMGSRHDGRMATNDESVLREVIVDPGGTGFASDLVPEPGPDSILTSHDVAVIEESVLLEVVVDPGGKGSVTDLVPEPGPEPKLTSDVMSEVEESVLLEVVVDPGGTDCVLDLGPEPVPDSERMSNVLQIITESPKDSAVDSVPESEPDSSRMSNDMREVEESILREVIVHSRETDSAPDLVPELGPIPEGVAEAITEAEEPSVFRVDLAIPPTIQNILFERPAAEPALEPLADLQSITKSSFNLLFFTQALTVPESESSDDPDEHVVRVTDMQDPDVDPIVFGDPRMTIYRRKFAAIALGLAVFALSRAIEYFFAR